MKCGETFFSLLDSRRVNLTVLGDKHILRFFGTILKQGERFYNLRLRLRTSTC